MRITFLSAAADFSGGSRVIHTYASRLHARGHQVTVAARAPRATTVCGRIAERLGIARDRSGFSASHYRRGEYGFTVLDPRRPIGADDVPDGDLVIATWWETAEWMAAMPAAKGRHVHFIQHYEAFGNTPRDRVDAVLRAPTYKIAISRWLDTMLKEQFANRRVAMVPNSVDAAQFHAPPRTRQPSPTIGMVYSVTDWKDCRSGFAAFELFSKVHPGARLVTFGHTAERPDLPLPAGTTHTVLPDQDRIRDIYAGCDVWFCSSTQEGFGLPALEAMACRCPVISTPVGGPIDFMVEGVNGFFVPIGAPAAMAATLDRFFALSEAQWQAMSDAAHATASGYDWDDAAALFERALEDALAEPEPAGG